MRVQRHKTGSVRLDKRRGVWGYLWCEAGKRRSKAIGSKAEFPTKAAAWREVERRNLVCSDLVCSEPPKPTVTVRALVDSYRTEKMPRRYSTRRSYDAWLRLYVLPHWGDCAITELQSRPVELWLNLLDLAPRSKTSIRGMLNLLWDYAMWRGDAPTTRNPMNLVTIPGA